MIFGIYANSLKDKDGAFTKEVYLQLKSKSCEAYISNTLREMNIDASYLSDDELFKKCDIVVVLGGDGTILRVLKHASRFNNLILALNIGSRGFLTESKPEGFKDLLDEIIARKYHVDKRDMLQVRVGDKVYFGLNDVVLSRGSTTRAGKFNVSVNGQLVDKYTSDGVIVSTPTGSTAYNLSSGGPIIAPDVEAFVITPIAAHSLHTRPIVTNSSNMIKLSVSSIYPKAHLTIDGQDILSLQYDKNIEITRSEKQIRFIRSHKYDYYNRFLSKLLNWAIV